MIPWILARFALAKAGGVFLAVWNGFLRFIMTPVGAAIVAALIMYPVAAIHARNKVNMRWQTKWDQAAAEAERRRIDRDVQIKKQVSAEVDARTAYLRTREADLQKKVESYVKTDADARCLTDDSDTRWLRNVRRSNAQRSR